MVTIKNKFLLLAAGFWLSGLLLTLIGVLTRIQRWAIAESLLTLGLLAQAIGFGFLGFAIMQAVFSKKK